MGHFHCHGYAKTVQFLIHSTASYVPYSLGTMLACAYNTKTRDCLSVSQICFSLKKDKIVFYTFEISSNQHS